MGVTLGILGGAVLGGVTGGLLGPDNSGELDKIADIQRQASARQNIAQATGQLHHYGSTLRATEAQRARSLLHGALGAPGTYEKSYEDFVSSNRGLFKRGPGGALIPKRSGRLFYEDTHPELRRLAAATDPSDANTGAAYQASLMDAEGQLEAHARAVSKTLPNPKSVLKATVPTREFRLVSFLTALADQLARGVGSLYEELTQSILGPIYQGAATLTRESAAQISRMVARGGSARRAGLAEALKMRAQENINRDRANNLFQAKLALEQYAIQNAQNQLAFNQAYVAGLPGINDAFIGLQTQLSTFYNSTIVPTAIGVAREGANAASQALQLQMEEDNAKFNRIMGGIIAGAGIGAGIVSGPSTGGSGFTGGGFFGSQAANDYFTSSAYAPRTNGPIFGGGYRAGTGG